jgi:hypothetical protein
MVANARVKFLPLRHFKCSANVVEVDNCVGGLFSVVVVSSSALMFVIHWYRSRISESIFSVKRLFGSKSLRKPVTKIRNALRRYKPRDSLLVINQGRLDTFGG